MKKNSFVEFLAQESNVEKLERMLGWDVQDALTIIFDDAPTKGYSLKNAIRERISVLTGRDLCYTKCSVLKLDAEYYESSFFYDIKDESPWLKKIFLEEIPDEIELSKKCDYSTVAFCYNGVTFTVNL